MIPTTKKILDNGLTILLKEMHHAPVTCFMIWYRVGSRNEIPGVTGISHWVEHMMFKGTPTFPDGTLDRLISREGGHWNAYTWIDFTAYYETMPAHKIDLAIQLEADRMCNTLMTEAEVEAERSVIISERQMYENDPRFELNEELTSVAFRVHPYHHEVIGDMVDLHSMTRDDLFGYYQKHYVPSNAIVVVVGDFATDEMLAKIEDAYGRLAAGEPVTAVSRHEPEQKGERRFVIEGHGDTTYLTFAYRAPAAKDPDFFPFVLLNAALVGGDSLGMFGGGGSNKSSRLYKAVVQTGLAATVYGGLTPTVDPFLYTIQAVVQAEQSVMDVETALQTEIDRLVTEPITQTELDKALKRAKAEFVLAGESITGQAQLLGMCEAVVGDYGWYETVLEQLAQVTLDDIERVRQQYLGSRQRIVATYLAAEDDDE